MTSISQKTLQDVYDAFQMMLENHPEGINSKSVWQEFFPQYSESTISKGTNMLVEEGYLIRKRIGRWSKLVLTGKEFKHEFLPQSTDQQLGKHKSSPNKPRVVTPTVQHDVFNGVILMHTKHPNGVPSMCLYKQMFENDLSYSYVSSALSELERTGHLASRREGKGKVYWPTGKQFLPTEPPKPFTPPYSSIRPGARDGRYGDELPPKQELFKPKDPSDPNGWVDDMNKLLSALDKFEEAIPGLRNGLLDLSKHLERLSKVKDILAGVEKAARRNL